LTVSLASSNFIGGAGLTGLAYVSLEENEVMLMEEERESALVNDTPRESMSRMLDSELWSKCPIASGLFLAEINTT